MDEYLEQLMSALVGGTIIQAGAGADDECGITPVIAVKCKDGITRTVWFLSDEEGNGPGHPHIQEQ